MKRLLIFLLPIFFISCYNPYTKIEDYTFVNNSSIDVSFTVKGHTYDLQSGESCLVQKTLSDNYSILNHPRIDIKPIYSDYRIIFVNKEYTIVNVYNSASVTITLSETNGLLGDNYGDTLSIGPAETKTFKLYTNRPAYKATTLLEGNPVPVSIDFLLFY